MHLRELVKKHPGKRIGAIGKVLNSYGPSWRPNEKERLLQIFVRDNNVDQAMKVLKKKMQREGVFRELKRKRFYEKPSEKRAREKGEAIRRARKLVRKQAQREGLLPAPKKRVMGPGGPRR